MISFNLKRSNFNSNDSNDLMSQSKISRKSSTQTQSIETQKIGVVTYYQKNSITSTNNYCIYTFEPIYQIFVENIKSAYDNFTCTNWIEMKTHVKDEGIISIEVISQNKLKQICKELKSVSGSKVRIDKLDNLFKDIESDEYFNMYDYVALLTMPRKDYLTIIDLDKKVLSDYRTIPDAQLMMVVREYINKIRDRNNIFDIISMCNEKNEKLKEDQIKTSIIRLYNENMTEQKLCHINVHTNVVDLRTKVFPLIKTIKVKIYEQRDSNNDYENKCDICVDVVRTMNVIKLSIQFLSLIITITHKKLMNDKKILGSNNIVNHVKIIISDNNGQSIELSNIDPDGTDKNDIDKRENHKNDIDKNGINKNDIDKNGIDKNDIDNNGIDNEKRSMHKMINICYNKIKPHICSNITRKDFDRSFEVLLNLLLHFDYIRNLN
jgi:hypothetical protein